MGAQRAPYPHRYLKGVSEALEEDRLCKIRINIMNQEQTGTLRNTMSGSLLIAKNSGFEPKTVIDVGAALGTFNLYETFPEARHLLSRSPKMNLISPKSAANSKVQNTLLLRRPKNREFSRLKSVPICCILQFPKVSMLIVKTLI